MAKNCFECRSKSLRTSIFQPLSIKNHDMIAGGKALDILFTQHGFGWREGRESYIFGGKNQIELSLLIM